MKSIQSKKTIEWILKHSLACIINITVSVTNSERRRESSSAELLQQYSVIGVSTPSPQVLLHSNLPNSSKSSSQFHKTTPIHLCGIITLTNQSNIRLIIKLCASHNLISRRALDDRLKIDHSYNCTCPSSNKNRISSIKNTKINRTLFSLRSILSGYAFWTIPGAPQRS